MKKQKKPIILVLVLAALCGGAAIMNKPQGAQTDQPPQSKDTPQQEDKSKVASDVASQVKVTKPKEQAMAHRHPGMPGGDSPSILKPKTTNFKPKPSDSATSTQWYTDESPRK